ncbi:hypothetical protein TNCT_56721 [Trichonephila clavata]|uniref:Uncharacterized protein n=1 Tax=Trichonephila clavata TaxID=2740835 RepID=A0A8X6HI32_TRICU|nr:hypothetical protein TNCT_56721 [Trichonephila clavata]
MFTLKKLNIAESQLSTFPSPPSSEPRLSNHVRDAVQDITTRHSLSVKDSISITKHDDLRHHYKVRYPQSNFWAARYMRHQHLRSRL